MVSQGPSNAPNQQGGEVASVPSHVTGAPQASHRLLQCWGKTDKESGRFHPAIFHMLDVGLVARTLLSEAAPRRWRQVLGSVLGCQATDLTGWLPYLIALHDIGKLSGVFQAGVAAQKTRLEQLGFALGPQDAIHHSTVGQAFVQESLAHAGTLVLPPVWTELLAESTGAHHGRFSPINKPQEARLFLRNYEPSEWLSVRAEAVAALERLLVEAAPTTWPSPTNVSAAAMALTGFTILCDWLGSDSTYFYPEQGTSLTNYATLSDSRAHRALEAAGLMAPCSSSAPTPFALLFSDKRPPRPLQSAIDAIPDSVLSGPCLAIIEAPTGEGKTEAALALAHRLAQARGTDEFYYALPTTATSNQMFLRLQEHLRTRLELPTQAKLVHGQAFLVEDDLRLQLSSDASRDDQRAALEWFSPRKRALLAPFGVGTVDQVELAVLNVKHTALRLIGLAGKVVIFDEVHAYDTYMTTIIEMLLRWLRVLGTSVIVLSATLPRLRRAALARAYGAQVDEGEAGQAYPSLWLYGQQSVHHAAPPAQQPHRAISLQAMHMSDDDASTLAKARWLLDAVESMRSDDLV